MFMKTLLMILAFVWVLVVFSCVLGNNADDDYYLTQSVDISPLLAAIERGENVLYTMDRTNGLYGDLKTLIDADKDILRDADLYTQTVSTAQAAIINAAMALHTLIDKISPLPKPPEVTE
jgi:hypothetical protein